MVKTVFTKEEVDQIISAKSNGVSLESALDAAKLLGITLQEFNQKNINDGMPILSFDSVEPSLEQVHWNTLLLNKYKYGIKLAMLLKDGYKPKMMVSIEGDRRGKENSKERIVIFDREYVIKKLIREVVIPFKVMPINEVLELVTEAYHAYLDDVPAYSKHTDEYVNEREIYETIKLQK